MKRAHIFNAGPAVLPIGVLENASRAILEYDDLGLSLIEMSHRSKNFAAIQEEAMQNLREVMNIPSNYEVIFMQGGASLQFLMIPLNFLKPDEVAHYVDTGAWATKAVKEARNVGVATVVASSKDRDYTYIPDNIPDTKCAYVHITSNNTIYGTRYSEYPKIKNAPLICDMSSDILCRKVDICDFGMIYAGAQKNIGPSGITVIVIKKDLLESAGSKTNYLNYMTHAKGNSLYNTPCTFATYVMGEVLKWMKARGGLDSIEENNRKKANLLYECIDNSGGFYLAPVEKNFRSWMNIPYRLTDENLEAKFLKEASEKKLIGLKGHRSVGGIRASLYNALPIESVEALIDFMESFRKKNS